MNREVGSQDVTRQEKPYRWDIILLSSLALILLLPSFVFVVLDQSSLAAGILVAGMLVAVLNTRNILNFLFSGIVFLLLLLLCAISASAFFSLASSGEVKPLMSLVVIVVLLAAVALGRRVHIMNYEVLIRAVYYFLLFLVALGWLALIWTPAAWGYTLLEKPVFPYSEESHYALAIGMLACGQVYVDKTSRSLFILTNMFLLAILFPNLTLLVFFLIAAFIFTMRFQPIFFWILLVSGLIGAIFFAQFVLPHFEYFSSRLDFSETNNLTTLVFLQGWAMAWLNLVETQGVGLGFQMLGEVGTTYPHYTARIVDLTGREFNTSDGGLLAAKVIAELGILGVVLVGLYLIFILRFVIKGNAWRYRVNILPLVERQEAMKRLMLLGFAFGFLVEVFLRGYGYFSPGVFWLVTILYALDRMRARRQSELTE
ncbi:hypothetical protein [Halomonas sp. Ps84H-12]|uniref:hypothetical protein n=1 Tax=Halomonas sp. Ps84H-12 TaxID=2954501 RepID=UPI002097F62A|nr:hypothetical protein [Halomonas sp. Ps84H-12]MCO7244521.1 hypothetical protein [Halomonas sp. Ps84H-12]